MIKIKPYTELSNRDEIFRLYLSMAAKALPFYPEDIFPEGCFYPDGKTKNPLSKFQRKAAERSLAYLRKFPQRVACDINTITEMQADALLAETIIRDFSDKLHEYLYAGAKGDGHIVTEHLYTLLTMAVDDNSISAISHSLKEVLDKSPSINKQLQKDMLDYVFRYDIFSSQKQIHHFVNLLGVDICPYCNRLYITTVERSKDASPIRPELDHYRSKSKYPFLALSILNLIPSCPVCNHVKGDKDRLILYPYQNEMGTNVVFRTQPISGITYLTGGKVASENFNLTLQCVPGIDENLKKQADLSIKELRLSELYSAHKDYVSDIMLQRYVFSDAMIEEIKNRFPDLFHTTDEVRNMLYLTDTSHENWGNRPLTKLTNDILLAAGEIDQSAPSYISQSQPI